MSKPAAEALPPVTIVVFTGTSGLTHYAWSLARALSAWRRVELLAGSGCLEAGYPPLACAVLPFFGRTRRYPLDLLRLFSRLLRRRGQLVLVQGLLKNAVVEGLMYRLLRLAGVRVAMTVHDALPHYPTRWSRATHRWLYTGVDRLVVHAERTRADLQALGVERPMAVIPHGAYEIFDTEALQPAQARRLYSRFAADDFVLLFFGRIDRRKGIDAFLRLREQLPAAAGWRYVVAGRNGVGRDEAELAALLEAARRDPHCLVRDDDVPFAEVQRYFRIADAVVLPYREGTTSGVLKLAMAFGLPVVATDVGDLGEALRADPLGVLVPALDEPSQLPAAVMQLREHMPAFLQAARETRARYAWQSIGVQYDRMLRALAPAGTPGA